MILPGEECCCSSNNDKEKCEGIFARIYYPSEALSPDKYTIERLNEFMQWKPDEKVIEGLAAYKGMSSWKLNLILDWILGDKRIPARWQVPLAKSEEQFPVVVFSHGISGTRQLYSINCSSLSSHGYVVAALDHRDGSSCYTYELNKDPSTGELIQKHIEMKKLPHEEQEYESRIAQVEHRTLETINMLKLFKKLNEGLRNSNVEIVCGNEFDWEQFKGRLNLDKAISIGHSFGGASALTSCAIEKGFKCCVVMDAWLYPFECKYYEEITQPVLMLNASKWQWPMNLKRLLHLQQQNGGEGKSMYTLTDIVHQSFSDLGLLTPGRIGKFMGFQGQHDPEYLANIIIQLITTFIEDPINSKEKLKEISKTLNCPVLIEGTDVPREKLDEISLDLAENHSSEIGENEERILHESGE
uniref:1-alkyl-2-acetylglycerophosphocholine esterase n=1 Tax=Meloidogyne javanica TaxID=6303 RepID=A0A915MJM5_MELJA